jgi:cytochrome c oxidase cbb3-type subunit 3
MSVRRGKCIQSQDSILLAAAAFGLALIDPAIAQQAQPPAPPPVNQPQQQNVPAQSAPPFLANGVTPSAGAYAGGSSASKLLSVPVSRLSPGNVPIKPNFPNPQAGKAEAIQRGMNYFVSFNCVGCHAPNGGGGMGPALSNRTFIYGGDPANIYLSIYQGRPNGMPAWGAMLPDSLIWDLVSYIQSISGEPAKQWGQTISRETLNTEQVPAEYLQTDSPWAHTQSFSAGQKPNKAR